MLGKDIYIKHEYMESSIVKICKKKDLRNTEQETPVLCQPWLLNWGVKSLPCGAHILYEEETVG